MYLLIVVAPAVKFIAIVLAVCTGFSLVINFLNEAPPDAKQYFTKKVLPYFIGFSILGVIIPTEYQTLKVFGAYTVVENADELVKVGKTIVESYGVDLNK